MPRWLVPRGAPLAEVQNLVNGALRLIDRRIGIGVCCGMGVAHPGDLAVGPDEPMLATGLDEGHRSRVQ